MDQLLRITPSVPYLFSDSPLCSIYINYGAFPIHVLSGVFFESRRDEASCESCSIYHISTYIIKGAQIKPWQFWYSLQTIIIFKCWPGIWAIPSRLYSMYYFAHLLFNLLIIPHKKTHECWALLTRFLVFNSSGENVMLNELYLLLVLIYICRFEFCQIDIN